MADARTDTIKEMSAVFSKNRKASVEERSGKGIEDSRDPEMLREHLSTRPFSAESGTEPSASYYRALAEAGIGGEGGGLRNYADLDDAKKERRLQQLVAAIKETQLEFIDQLRQPVTWVYEDEAVQRRIARKSRAQRRILVGGIRDSTDVDFLRSVLEEERKRCDREEDKPTEMVLVSIHPDDWVSQGRWALHGRYKWEKQKVAEPIFREAGLQERLVRQGGQSKPPNEGSPVVDQLLVELLDQGNSPLLYYLPDICTFADQHRERSPTTVVMFHCKMGMSRSVAAVVGYEMWRHYQAVRGSSEWQEQGEGDRVAELKCVKQNFADFMSTSRKGANLDKFGSQLDLWAEWLVCGVDTTSPPPLPLVKPKLKGAAMRDAAVIVFYQHNQLPPLNLIEYYQERVQEGRGAGLESSVTRWDAVTVEGREPLSVFMRKCKAVHAFLSKNGKQ